MKSKAAKKNALLNGVMVAAIALIAVSGLLLVGRMKGWFEKEAVVTPDDGNAPAVLTDVWTVSEKSGSANIYRGGLAYALKEQNRLRSEDTVETLNRSALTVTDGDKLLKLDENSRMGFVISEEGTDLTLESGGAFLNLDAGTTLTVNGETVRAENATVLASASYGSGTVAVLSGEASLGERTLRSGERASLLAEEQGGVSTVKLSLNGCSGFELNCIRTSEETLCFSAEDVTALEQQREQEKQLALEAVFLSESDAARVQQLREQQEKSRQGNTVTPAGNDPAPQGGGDNAPMTPGTDKEEEEDLTELFMPVCTIEIRCDTILENMGDLTPGKEGYVPANGLILAPSKITFTEGETAFDVLKRACDLAGIQLEYAWTPLYNSYYIEGINNLYEFDCGEQSGWMYKVNGWFPNYGCSSYKLEDGDVMVWCFTCKGLGADVGGTVY